MSEYDAELATAQPRMYVRGSSPEAQSWSAWFAAARQPTIDAALRGLYDRLDEAVRARGPVCWSSGRCCKFDQYGHRLYVTALEVAWVWSRRSAFQVPRSELKDESGKISLTLAKVNSGPGTQNSEPTGCPFQIDNLCSVHAIRPLGCRVFFCQRGTEEWQHGLYERFQAELRALHEAHGLEYRYLEWRAGLREAQGFTGAPGITPADSPASAQ